MPRYIDADKFRNNLEKASEKMHLIGGVKGVDIGAVIVALDRQPTADVVPKSEVDLYKKLNDELEDELASTYDKLENAKTEVAREIFEEIENAIDLNLLAIKGYLNSKGMRANGKTILFAKYEVFTKTKNFLDDLKKKYTGELR